MSSLLSLRRLSKRSVAAVAALLVVVALLPWGTLRAFANTAGNATYGGFEIDGNLYDGTDNSSTTSTHPAEAPDDWTNLLSVPTGTDPVGSADTTSFTSSKECSTTGDCQTDDWNRSTNGLASPKDDLSKLFVGSRLVPDKNGDLWGYFGFERADNNGTTFFDFELNQDPNHTNGSGSTAISVPTRSPGDVLIVAQQQGSGPHSALTISGTIQRWTQDNSKCDTGLTANGSAGGCWTAPTTLDDSAFYGLSNDSTVTDLPASDGALGERLFGEFAINLTAAGAVVGCPSRGYVAVNVRTRSSISDTSEMKDYMQGDVGIPSACGELKIEKYDDGGTTLVPGATFQIMPNPITGTGSLTVKDGGTGDADGAANGVVDTSAIPTGQLGTTYSVEETVPPPGYLLPTSGNPQDGVQVSKFGSGDDATVISFNDPKIVTKLTLKKSTSTAGYAAPGDAISYSYVAKNTGNVPLKPPYAVADDKTSVTCDQTPNPLPVGGTFSCTATYTVTQADVDAGSVTNVASATATYRESTVTSNQDTVTVDATQHPALSLQKSSPDTSYNVAGEVLDYSYLLTNTGNVTLSAPYTVSDDKSTTEQCPSTPTTLAPGHSVTCTSTYPVTQADLDAGSVTNHATATARWGDSTVTSNEDHVTIPAAQGPALTLAKSAAEPSYDAVGQVLDYTYTLTNSGNTTLTAPFAVADDKIATVDCSQAASPLAVGASTTCTASYPVTQADLDAGAVTNHATATAKAGDQTVTSNEADATVPGAQHPAATLVKSVDKSTASYGDTLTYTFRATNAGNVSLADVVVTDVVPDGTTYVAGSATPNATFDPTTNTVSWAVGSMAAGASVDGLSFRVTVDTPTYDLTVGLPAETIDNVGAVAATGLASTPSNHVRTPVTAVLAVTVKKPTTKPQTKPVVKPATLPFTGLPFPVGPAMWTALALAGVGALLTSVRRRRSA